MVSCELSAEHDHHPPRCIGTKGYEAHHTHARGEQHTRMRRRSGIGYRPPPISPGTPPRPAYTAAREQVAGGGHQERREQVEDCS